MANIEAEQAWLPGLEPDSSTLVVVPRRSGRRPVNRPPRIDKLVAQAAPRVGRLFTELRQKLLGETSLEEQVEYDDSAGAFHPVYGVKGRVILSVGLDPLLAVTVTLEQGERQLARLLISESLPESIKTHAMRFARRSGRRVFLAFLVRNKVELANLMALVRERVAME